MTLTFLQVEDAVVEIVGDDDFAVRDEGDPTRLTESENR